MWISSAEFATRYANRVKVKRLFVLLAVKVRTPGIVLANELSYTNAIESCLMVDKRHPWELACMFLLTFPLIYLLVNVRVFSRS